jgi:hypothetical protein
LARQKGILRLDGKAGTLSFFQGRDRYKACKAHGISGSVFSKKIFLTGPGKRAQSLAALEKLASYFAPALGRLNHNRLTAV